MHGGMKVYVGDPAAARAYVEADRGRADDYYLAEGSGFARRFTATDGRVAELLPLTGDGYETWVAGRDPDTGQPRGHLRDDDRAVRFVEVVVNGPKTWSLAAALHPDIAAAYEAAQDRAAGQIIGWLAQHATTRVGPRGGQVQVPLEVLEAATVRHYTSRAEDPHWHLHLQILSRVFAAGKWRGCTPSGSATPSGRSTGSGTRRWPCDPELNAAFAAHGYTKDATGELRELADYVGPFSARNAQIARNVDRYEREWTAAHPGEHPGPALRRAWDARAWADGRPDKVIPQPGANLDGTLAGRAVRARLPRPGRSRRPDAHPGRRPRSRGLVRARVGPAGGGPVGVERRGRPRRGGAADRRRGRRRRRGGAPRAGRGPHRPRHGPAACRCWTATACPSTSGPGRRSRSSTSRPT